LNVLLLTFVGSEEGFVVTDLSSANGTLISDGDQVINTGLP
jgi:hypothetical protein